MKGEVSPDPESLVAHRGFVEALARRLVDDRHVAEDLAQETFLAALRNPPKAAALRGFLARVLRKRRARWLRDEERRLRKERAAARPDRAEGGLDLVARLSWHRRVVDALLALEEPFRTTLLLRFYEDLKPGQIAERLGVPPGTVRARLSRGLERMRARLDADHEGDRRSWQLGLLPLLSCARPRGVLLGVAAMTAGKKVVTAAALVLALAGTGYVTLRTLQREAPPERSAAPRAPVTVAEVDRAPDPTSIATAEGSTLVVRVRNERDEPIAGAEVLVLPGMDSPGPGFVPPDIASRRWAEISRESPAAIARGVTDGTGCATLAGLAGEGWDVHARRAGYGSATRSFMWQRPEEVTIHLGPARTLRGRVTFVNGDAVAGAVVLVGAPSVAWNPGYGDPPLRTVADANGEFLFEALPARDVALFAAFPGGIAFHVATLRFPGPDRFDITLERGGVLTGVVTDKTGAPLAGADVRVASWETNSKCRGAAPTDAAGRYVIDALPPCTISHVSVEKQGYSLDHAAASHVRTGIALQSGETVTLDLRMVPGASVRGLVVGPDGPAAGVAVDAWTSRDTGILAQNTTTDAEGRFLVDSLAAGKHLVQAWPRDGSKPEGGYPENPFKALEGNEPKPYVVVLREGEVREHVIRLIRGERVVEGLVFGPDGRPFPGARVAAKGASTESAGDGRFRLEHVFDDAEHVVAFAKGLKQALPKPAPAATGVVIRLEHAPPAARVAGTVRGPNEEVPAGACVLLAVPGYGGTLKDLSEERLWYAATRHPVTATGTFEIELPTPEPGKFWLRASAPGYADGEPLELAPTEAGAVHEAHLSFTVGHALAGAVVDASSGRPLPGARISVRRPRPPYWSVMEDPLGPGDAVAAVADAAGVFRVENLAAGWWEVAASCPGYVEGVAKHELPGGAVRVALARTLSISGVVTYPDGSPVADVCVYARPVKRSGQGNRISYGNKTNAEGYFRRDGLEPGDYRVWIQCPFLGEPNIVETEVTPVAAGTTDLRVIVERGLSIGGKVVDGEGKPVQWIMVRAQLEHGPIKSHSAQTGEDGSFEIFGLRDGSYTLRFTKEGDAGVRATRTGIRAGTRDLTQEIAPAMQPLSIEGVLVDETGLPLANRTVAAVGADPAKTKHASTDADGRFAIRDLEPGRKDLRLRPDNGSPYLADLGEAEAGTHGLRLVPRRGAVIRGSVSLEGAPLPGVQVSARFGDDNHAFAIAKTDASGAFAIGGIPEGARCVVSSYGSDDAIRGVVQDIASGATGVRLVLRRGLEARGRLLDADGAPVAKVALRIHDEDDLGGRFRRTETDVEGRFVVKGLTPGPHDVAAHLDYEWRPCGTIDAGATGVELRLPAR